MHDAVTYLHDQSPPFRLPNTLKPSHYDICIDPDLPGKRFSGRVTLHLEAFKSTNVIAFHTLRLDVTHISVERGPGGTEYPRIEYVTEHEVAYARLQEQLSAGSKFIVMMDYLGEMTGAGSMGGLLPSPYQMPTGEVKLGFETMMEPTMVRAVFPCLDEPEIKATFTVSLFVDADLTCISNMDAVSENLTVTLSGQTKKKVVFGKTPRMSTYLVVFVAGYFNVLESNDFHVPIRVWAAIDKDIRGSALALKVAVKALKAHERNFGVKYPLPKLDMVAVPGHVGGMEHWGCVTYQENGIILSDKPSAADKLRLASLITHELDHQWFGNIVTMEWWDSIWLNESFSDWATVHALKQMFPEFDSWANFLASDPSETTRGGYQEALRLDSNRSTHAILDPNLPPSAAFDTIATNLTTYKLNTDQVGFYRISYNLSRIHKLGTQFSGNLLSIKDKVGIISDLAAVVGTGRANRQIRLSDFLDFLQAIKDQETDLFVWREILAQLENIRAAFLFDEGGTAEILRRVRLELLSHFAKKQYLDFQQIFFKTLLFSQLKDHPLTQKIALEAWNKLINGDKDALNPNIRKHIFDTVLQLDGSHETWNKIRYIAYNKTYIRKTDPATPLDALEALGSSPNPGLVARALDIITPPSCPSSLSNPTAPIFSNRVAMSSILRSLGKHRTGAKASWDWLRGGWHLLRREGSKGSINSNAYIGAALGGLCTANHLAEIEQFFADKVDHSFQLELAQAIDVIRVRFQFSNADHGDLLAWAKKRGYTPQM
ncbi:peptidase family M1-domain-containing protein [Pseudomassariella vexata]|uniref:Aminopeptidase n=1 Tax=Pseudomassariella vexata TaxID=1141098 RepID=A0A1Y2DZR5_9PEZI|nr:peptidase family M1-domain-containing protein [Pseudomassariella vexata]ORY64780.1 peptidase family M1-domain-containing protein [Pseudomassariella vexata]